MYCLLLAIVMIDKILPNELTYALLKRTLHTYSMLSSFGVHVAKPNRREQKSNMKETADSHPGWPTSNTFPPSFPSSPPWPAS